jgi:hypothetical protein
LETTLNRFWCSTASHSFAIGLTWDIVGPISDRFILSSEHFGEMQLDIETSGIGLPYWIQTLDARVKGRGTWKQSKAIHLLHLLTSSILSHMHSFRPAKYIEISHVYSSTWSVLSRPKEAPVPDDRNDAAYWAKGVEELMARALPLYKRLSKS